MVGAHYTLGAGGNYGLRENSTFEYNIGIFTASQSNDSSTVLFTTRGKKFFANVASFFLESRFKSFFSFLWGPIISTNQNPKPHLKKICKFPFHLYIFILANTSVKTFVLSVLVTISVAVKLLFCFVVSHFCQKVLLRIKV